MSAPTTAVKQDAEPVVVFTAAPVPATQKVTNDAPALAGLARPAVPQEPGKQERLASNKTLTAADKAELAALWGMPETDERFVLLMNFANSYKFMRTLAPESFPFVRKDLLQRAGRKLNEWPGIRREHVTTLNSEDEESLLTEWGMDRTDKRVNMVFNKTQPHFYDYFRNLPKTYREVVTVSQISDMVPDSVKARKDAIQQRADAGLELIRDEAKAKAESERRAKGSCDVVVGA